MWRGVYNSYIAYIAPAPPSRGDIISAFSRSLWHRAPCERHASYHAHRRVGHSSTRENRGPQDGLTESNKRATTLTTLVVLGVNSALARLLSFLPSCRNFLENLPVMWLKNVVSCRDICLQSACPVKISHISAYLCARDKPQHTDET